MIRKALFLFTLLFVVGVSTEARVRVKLTKAMYNDPYCPTALCDVFAVNIYGHPSVPAGSYADLANYETLVVEVEEGTPRFLFNVDRGTADPNNGAIVSWIEIPANETLTKRYQTIEELEDGKKAYIINLKQMMADEGKVHLNCIKSAGFETNIGVIVTRMYLLKPIPAENTSYDATVLDPNEILLTPRYKISDTYLDVNELASATDGFAIVNDNKVLCVDDDVPHIETREKTRLIAGVTGFDDIATDADESVFKNTYKNELALSWRFILEEGDVLEGPQYNTNYRFHHYDAYSDKYSELGYACASPYKHLWMTMLREEPEEKHYYNGKENCLYGPNWLIESVGDGELKSVGELQSTPFYAVSAEGNMVYLNTSSENAQVGGVADVLNNGSAYRRLKVIHEFGEGQDAQYRIELLNAQDQGKYANGGTFLNIGTRSEVFVGPSLERGINPDDLVANQTKVTLQMGDRYLYVPNNVENAHDCSMGTQGQSSAKDGTVAVWCFRLEKVSDGYLFRALKPDGKDFSVYGVSPCYLNSTVDGNLTFVLGLNGRNGQDMENGAVWTFESGGIKNVGTGQYLNGNRTSKDVVVCSLRHVEGQFEQWDLKPQGGAELDWGSFWHLEYVENVGFAFRNNGWKENVDGKRQQCYLGADGKFSKTPVYFKCYDPSKFVYSDGKAVDSYVLRSVGVAQGNFNVDNHYDDDFNEYWTHENVYDAEGYLTHMNGDYDKGQGNYVEDAEGNILRTREGWRSKKAGATRWRFKKIDRVPEADTEDRLIADLVFALRHMRANEFNRYQCYNDEGQPTLTPAFEACWKKAHEYLYEQGQAYNGDVERLADSLEYYNARLHLVKPKPGDFIRMQGEKNETYFSGSSSSTVYPMVSSPSASTIFYYDGSKLVNYSTGLVFAKSENFDIGTQLMEEDDKIVQTTLFADSRATRFADQRKENPVRHTYSVYMGETDTDKVLIAKNGEENTDGDYMSSGLYAHAAFMAYPEPGSEYGGQYNSETEILLTKVVDLPINVPGSGYATFCCPQDAYLVTEGATAYMAEVNKDKTKVTFIDVPNGQIPANTPVLIELKTGGSLASGTVIARVRTTGSPYTALAKADKNCLLGKYYTRSYTKGDDRLSYENYKIEKQPIGSHVYSLTTTGVWKYYTGSTIPAFKACLNLKDVDEETQSVKTFAFAFGEEEEEVDEETGIKVAEALGVESSSDVMYNLSGQRVISPRKGVYVVDGKKVLVK